MSNFMGSLGTHHLRMQSVENKRAMADSQLYEENEAHLYNNTNRM
jgi:hypothetical protein